MRRRRSIAQRVYSLHPSCRGQVNLAKQALKGRIRVEQKGADCSPAPFFYRFSGEKQRKKLCFCFLLGLFGFFSPFAFATSRSGAFLRPLVGGLRCSRFG